MPLHCFLSKLTLFIQEPLNLDSRALLNVVWVRGGGRLFPHILDHFFEFLIVHNILGKVKKFEEPFSWNLAIWKRASYHHPRLLELDWMQKTYIYILHFNSFSDKLELPWHKKLDNFGQNLWWNDVWLGLIWETEDKVVNLCETMDCVQQPAVTRWFRLKLIFS